MIWNGCEDGLDEGLAAGRQGLFEAAEGSASARQYTSDVRQKRR
jgi:hypothetical protein